MTITTSTYNRLESLSRYAKFVTDLIQFYIATPDESVRLGAERDVNLTIAGITEAVRYTPRKSAVPGYFKTTLPQFDRYDSEEKERALRYFEQVLSIIEIERSQELFNVWRYGFPYGWFLNNL